jgi:hypothetical protein
MTQRTRNPSTTRQARRTASIAEPIGGVAVLDIWTFTVEEPLAGTDLTRFSVEATDGKIGKIDEATQEADNSFLIVDTGPWIFGKKIMLPAGVVQRVDTESKTVFVNLSKDAIKNAPEYHEDGGREDKDYRHRLGDYYSEQR